VKAVVEQLQTNPDAVMGQIEADEELQRKLSTLVQAGATFFFFLLRLPLMRLSCCLPAQRVWPRACAVPRGAAAATTSRATDGRRHATRHDGRRHAARHDGRRHAARHDGRRHAARHDGRRHAARHDGRRHAARHDGRSLVCVCQKSMHRGCYTILQFKIRPRLPRRRRRHRGLALPAIRVAEWSLQSVQ
jgi:hypothetical protein